MTRRRDDGAVAVEMALVAPVLLVLLIGLIDFGFVFNAKIAVTQAAREAARVVALGGTESDARARAAQAVPGTDAAFNLQTSVVTGCGSGSDVAELRVTGTVDLILPLPSVGLESRGVMRCNG